MAMAGVNSPKPGGDFAGKAGGSGSAPVAKPRTGATAGEGGGKVMFGIPPGGTGSNDKNKAK